MADLSLDAERWLAVAAGLADEFAATARDRDLNRVWATHEITRFKESGLLNLSVPKDFGGAGLKWETLARLVREISRGDASLGMLLGIHFIATTSLWIHGLHGSAERLLADTVRENWFLGVVYNPLDPTLEVALAGDKAVLNGRKTFCTGAPLADRILVMANRADTKAPVNLVVTPGLPGLTILSDWDAIGMRVADSSSILFEEVTVGRDAFVSPIDGIGEYRPWEALFGLMVWLFYTNYYVGAARGAFEFARNYTLTRTRPWISSGVEKASQDPYILELYGQVYIELAGAELLVDRAGAVIEAAIPKGPALTEAERGEAAIALFTGRVAAARAALDATSRLFEAMGARAATRGIGFDRFWRDIRTHTLHHPLAYKTREVGDYALNGAYPNYKLGYA
ncbi:MAG TPA: acyl-CoA dehydrogenase family protein [Stellaceae bacterium]|nr:acyl-CoA dehydrogenase family protein [Stellaceae bacterium]